MNSLQLSPCSHIFAFAFLKFVEGGYKRETQIKIGRANKNQEM
jgi:hypothetical protein